MNAWQKSYTEDQTDQVAQELLSLIVPADDSATVVALQGDLGAGKTTLTKALAKQLGIADTVISPTFVIAKFYAPEHTFEHLMHIDAYRIESNDELAPLQWQEVLQQPKTLVIVEWPERIAGMLPEHAQYFSIAHDGDKRIIMKK